MRFHFIYKDENNNDKIAISERTFGASLKGLAINGFQANYVNISLAEFTSTQMTEKQMLEYIRRLKMVLIPTGSIYLEVADIT